jgi:mRNA-degrading endonuclease toxin of MazEF toxin-antitoxin module
MVERLVAVDPEARLGDFAGRLSALDMHAVDEALRAVLGLA